MSDDKVYKDGDVVWVKLGNNWWPGEVTGVHRQPEGLIKHLKRKPYCVVKFFQEDAYEYVKSAKQIFPFHCNKKDEFIKKGNALYNAKNKFMEKFPGDVEIAERLTRKTIDSDMLIINNRPDSIVKAILGQSMTARHSNDFYDSEYVSNTTGSNKRRSGDSVTKILNITQQRTIATPSATNTTDQHPNTPASSGPGRISSFNNNANFYRCNLCDFSSQRQNVMILHRRTHNSGGSTPSANTSKTATVTPATAKVASAVRRPPSASSVTKVHNSSAPSTPSSVPKVSRESTTPLRMRHSLPTCKLDDTATERNKFAAATGAADTDFASTPLGLPSADTPIALPINHTSTPWITSDPTNTSVVTAGAKYRKKKERARIARTLRSSPHIDADVSDITLPEAVPYTDTVDEDISDVSSNKTEVTVVSAATRTQKQSTKHIPLAISVSTPATKRKSEEIRQRLLADWSDEEKDEYGQLVVDESKSADMDVAAEDDRQQIALKTKDVKQETVTPPLVAATAPAIAGNRIRNIPKKDRRDVVLKDFNSDFTLSNSSSSATSASHTPPLVQIDGTSNSSSNDSVVLVVELPSTEPIDVDAEVTGGETEMIAETEADIKCEGLNEQLKAAVIDPAAAVAITNEISETAFERVYEIEDVQMEQQIDDQSVTANIEKFENEKTVEMLDTEQIVEELKTVKTDEELEMEKTVERSETQPKTQTPEAPVVQEIEDGDISAVVEQVELQIEELHSSEAISLQRETNTAATDNSETTNTTNKSNDLPHGTPAIVEKPHATDIEEPKKQPPSTMDTVATSAPATVAAALSCFDFQEEEEDTESDVLKSIANFKKKYTSPDKAQTQTLNTVSEQQRTTAARISMDGKSIKSPQRLAELEQKDQQLAADIETLLEQTSATVVDMSAIAAPALAATVVGGTVTNKEELQVKGLPIKERGKRIFKSRNRSRLDEHPPPAETTVEVSTKSVWESTEENAQNGSIAGQTHTELNNGVLAELRKAMVATDEPQLAEPTEELDGNNEMKVAEQPQELASTNVSSETIEENATVCEDPASHYDEPEINEQIAKEPEELLKEQCALTKESDAASTESQPVVLKKSEKTEAVDVVNVVREDDTSAPALLEAMQNLQHSANKLNSTQHSECPLTDVEENANVALLINEQNIDQATETQREENAATEASTVALTTEDSLCELKDTVDQQTGNEVISRFTSPTDENSSVGISEAGAEFGSPASMLDDERLTLLTNNLTTPTEGLVDTLTPESVESQEKCSAEDEIAGTTEKFEIDAINNTAVKGNQLDDTDLEQPKRNADQLLEKESAVKATPIDKIGATVDSVVAVELPASIEQLLTPEPVPAQASPSASTPIITVTEPELEEDEDEIESPPHEALSGNELEAEIEKARKLKMIKTKQSSRRKDKEKSPNIVKEYVEVETAKIDAPTIRLTRSKRASTTSNSELELIAATMETSTLKTQSARSKRASATPTGESIASNMETATANVECITANTMSTRSKRISTASNNDSLASNMELPTVKDCPDTSPTCSKRVSTASNNDSITSNIEYQATKVECISTRTERDSTASKSDSVISLTEPPAVKGECISPNRLSIRSKRASTASNSDHITSNMEHTTATLEPESPKLLSTRTKTVSTASNSESIASNLEHTAVESAAPNKESKRVSKRVSTASNLEHTAVELAAPNKESKRVSTASNYELTTSNLEHASPKIESSRSKKGSARSKRKSFATKIQSTTAPAQPESVEEPDSDVSPTKLISANKSNPIIEVVAPTGRRVTRSSLQNKTSPAGAELDLIEEGHTKEATTLMAEEVARNKPQQRRSRITRAITSSPAKEKLEVAAAADNQSKPEVVLNPIGTSEYQREFETGLVARTLTPNAAVGQKDLKMTQPTDNIEKIWTTEPVIVEKPSTLHKPAKEHKYGGTPAPDPLSIYLESESKVAARKRRLPMTVIAARRDSGNDVMSVDAEKAHADEHYPVKAKARKLEMTSTPTTVESQKNSSATKRQKSATTMKANKTKVAAMRAIEVTPTTAAPVLIISDMDQLSERAEHSEEMTYRPDDDLQAAEKGAVDWEAVSMPLVEATPKEEATVQPSNNGRNPKAVASATTAIEASPNILKTSQAVTATATATMTTASEMRLFRPRRKTLSAECAAADVKLKVTAQRGAERRKKSETDLGACNANGPSERVSSAPSKQQEVGAARQPSPIGRRHINVDVAHPLSSQIANIMAIAGASAEQQQQLKRRKSLEDDIPSFIIERRAQASESQLGGSSERDTLAHVQSLCPQMKITRKEKRIEPDVAATIVQQQRPQQQYQQQHPPQPVSKVAEAGDGAVFDIDNMPIVLSNEQMLSGMQFVIGTPSAGDAVAAACSTLPESPRILQQQIIPAARRSPPPLHQSKPPAPQRRQSSTNQRQQQSQQPQCQSNKQIGVDARGNKYVIIKTPPGDLNVQPAMSFQPPNVATSMAAKTPNVASSFKIGAGVTLRPISEPSSRTDSPVPPAQQQQQQLQLPPPPPQPPSFTKPKSPAAAVTGGRKQVGNTITLPSSITVKQQKLNDDLGVVDTCAATLRSPQITAASDVGNHGSSSKMPRRPPSGGGTRKQSQQQDKPAPSSSPAQMPLSQVKVQLQPRQQVQLQPRQVQQRRQTACAEKPPRSSTLTLTRRLSCTDTHLLPPAKIPKRSVGNDVTMLVEKQLLQLQQHRKIQTAPNTPTASSPPPLHHLHNRKQRKAPSTAQQNLVNAAVIPAVHPQAGAGGEVNMIVETHQPLLQHQNQLNQPAAAAVAGSQQQPQTHGFSTEPPPLVPAYSPADQSQKASTSATTNPGSMALMPTEAAQVTMADSTSAPLLRHRTSTDSNSTATVPYRTSESMPMVPCQTLVEYDQELEAKVLAVPTVPISKFSDTFRLCTISEDKFIPINELLFQLEKNQLKQVPREEWEDELPELLVQRARLEEWIFLPQLLALQTDGESETCLALICLPPTSAIAAQLQAAEAMEAAAAIEAAAAMEAVAAMGGATGMEVAADDAEDADVSADMETLVAVDGVSEGVGASAFLLHSDGHEMIIDAATFAQLLSNPDEQMDVVTQDGEVIRLTRASLLHSMVQRAQIAGTTAVEEQLQVAAAGNVSQLSGGDGEGGEAGPTDIIAVALAGSELYGSEVLAIDTPQALQMMSSDGSIVFQPPVLPQPHLTPPITAHTSETNAVLNQTPIMSTLEAPSTVASKCQPTALTANMAVTSALLAASASGLPGCRPNLDDSLAVIGLTTQSSAVPSSLELPITVTNPAIAPKVTMATQPVDIVQFHTQCAVSAAIASEPRIYNDPGS